MAGAVADTGQLGLIRLRTFLDHGFAAVEIEDTGKGIPESIRERAFEPSFTLRPGTEAMGRRLASAHAIVTRRHGGTLTLNNGIGRGMSSVVRLPLQAVS